MIRVGAYEYILQERARRESAKPHKPAGKGFSEILKEETKKLEEEEMEKTIKVALTVPEIRMIQELMDPQTTEYEYSWQREIADSLEKKMNDASPKPTMSKWDFDKEVEKEREKWPGKETAEGMARATAARLKFMTNVSKEEV